MSKKYSEKVRNLLERFDNHSLKILLEEDEDESEETSNSREEKKDVSFDFPTSGDDDKDDDKDDVNDDDISDVIDSEDNTSDNESSDLAQPEGEIDTDNSTDPSQLEDQLDNAVKDFQHKLNMSTTGADIVLAVDQQANSYLDNPTFRGDDYYEDDYYEDDYYEDDLSKRLQVDNYQRKSIGNFIFEEKEEDKVKQKKFDDIEAQIEKLEYLTNLMDDKFNRKTNQVNEADLPDILNKSIDLINFHDPVEYAHDETIKYISVKADPKLKERLIEDFKVMFNERCKKEGYDTSSITGMSTVSPTRFKTGVTGVQS
jgi:hypothetical protein